MFPPKDSPSFESMDEAWEYIQGQEPLPNVASNTDFNQGVERGKYIERTRIIGLLKDMVASMAAIDTGLGSSRGNMAIRVKAIETAIERIKGENK